MGPTLQAPARPRLGLVTFFHVPLIVIIIYTHIYFLLRPKKIINLNTSGTVNLNYPNSVQYTVSSLRLCLYLLAKIYFFNLKFIADFEGFYQNLFFSICFYITKNTHIYIYILFINYFLFINSIPYGLFHK